MIHTKVHESLIEWIQFNSNHHVCFLEQVEALLLACPHSSLENRYQLSNTAH
jgi:hypothetical protein